MIDKLREKKTDIMLWVVIILIIFAVYIFFRWGILEPVPKPIEIITPPQAVEQPVVVKGEYTLIYKASIPTYIKEHYMEDGRIYYLKDDNRSGSVAHIDARLEEGWIPYLEMYNYGFIDYVEEVPVDE